MARQYKTGPVSINIETVYVKQAVKALMQEADGKLLRAELGRNLKVAMTPVRDKARANIRAMPAGNATPRGGGSLRAAVARGTKVSARLAARTPTVALIAGKAGMPRGFANAPRRLNDPSFRHPVYGNRNVWRTQVGRPRWFDDPVAEGTPGYTAAVVKAVTDLSTRVATRTRGT